MHEQENRLSENVLTEYCRRFSCEQHTGKKFLVFINQRNYKYGAIPDSFASREEAENKIKKIIANQYMFFGIMTPDELNKFYK